MLSFLSNWWRHGSSSARSESQEKFPQNKEKEDENEMSKKSADPGPSNSKNAIASPTSPLSPSLAMAEEKKFDEKTFDDMKQQARKILEEVQGDYDKSVETHGPAVWNESLNTNKEKKRFAEIPGSSISKFDLSRAPEPLEGAKTCMVTTNSDIKHSGIKRMKVPIRRMNSVMALPPMTAWVSTLRNYAVEDQPTLTHIPQTEGDDHDKFVDDLIHVYGGHVHGYKSVGFVNDRMIFNIIQKLTAYYEKKHATDDEKVDPQDPPSIVFEAFTAEFPDKGTAKELQRNKYSDLLEKYDGGVRLKLLSEQVLPNIDGVSAISTSRERALHTYASLFCRRCYLYDCNLHGPPAKIPRRRVKPDPAWEEPRAPCGQHCVLTDTNKKPASGSDLGALEVDVGKEHLRSPSEQGLNTNITSSSQTNSRKAKRARRAGWTPRDETMFRVYSESFGPDRYCEIAFAMGNKTCKEVREFAQNEGLEPTEEPALSPNLIKRKGAKKGDGKVTKDQYHRFRVMKWAGQDGGKVFNAHPYTPCQHPPGHLCTAENCACARFNNACMKFCNCSSSCSNRFPGCRCRAHCNTKQCPCFMAMRECDPDLCSGCGANDFESEKINCTNVAIQRGWKEHLLLAPSDVAGWGAFLKDPVKKGDFIYEYTGELISQDEAERRGKIYDRTKTSYLFNLNNEQAVDATRKGNLIRFANHSRNPNCYAKVMMVNGDHRIGIYAMEEMERGEELFFDYRYSTQDKLRFVSIERPKDCVK